jgi:uncharacterized membrane protein
MSKTLFMIIFFGCFGITGEIFFTALTHAFEGTSVIEGEPVMSLTGKTYVWMFPIYALIPFFAGFLFGKLKNQFWLLRYFIYALVILAVEFVSGFILEQVTGKCPWEYTSGWHILGYIRLDYTPAWMGFAAGVEYLYRTIDERF